MLTRLRKTIEPYDVWSAENGGERKPSRLHPSSKRTKKNPLPHPGQSYNPDPEDHKKLLKKVLEKELEFQKKEARLRKALGVKMNPKKMRESEEEELLSGIEHLIEPNKFIQDKHDDSDGSSTEDAYSDYDDKDFDAILKDKRVEEKRKSRQKRMRQLKDRLQRRAAKLRKLKNIRLSKFDSLKKMVKELDKKDKEKAASAKKRHRMPKNERLSQKFEQSDPIYCLSAELPNNLRQASCPMNALVREQLESFQSRLMVEPTSLQARRRKYKRRTFDRGSGTVDEGQQDDQ